MKHNISRKLGLAIDYAIEEYTLEGVLNAPKEYDKWSNEFEPLNSISMFQLATYLIEGYDYPKSKEQSIDIFINWLKDYNNQVPYLTKNSSYRKGRRSTLEEIEKKLIELNLLDFIQ